MSETTQAEPERSVLMFTQHSLSRGSARANMDMDYNTNHFVREFSCWLYLKEIVVCSSFAMFPYTYFYADLGINTYKKLDGNAKMCIILKG